jgi:SAM-dependent methyltransferase
MHAGLRPGIGASASALLATLLGVLLALPHGSAWRRALVASGFPASALAGGAALPAWSWLLPLAVLAGAYPLRAWRDAPLFPTPPRALDALAAQLPLADGARVLDAGCGLGHGLRALRSAWPRARVHGVEWSWPLALAARLGCPGASVRRADMWAGSWAGFDLVYLFQRPESMARAWDKACAEMRAGAWLVSLEFALPGRAPDLRLPAGERRSVLAWRVPVRAHAQPARRPADNPG